VKPIAPFVTIRTEEVEVYETLPMNTLYNDDPQYSAKPMFVIAEEEQLQLQRKPKRLHTNVHHVE
jgi:hypothetical protein